MKKIAIIDYDMSIIGGVEKVSQNLANSLSKYYEVYLISLNNSKKTLPYQINKNVHYMVLNSTEDTRIRNTMKNTRKLLKNVLKSNKIELAICMGHYATFISIINSLNSKTKIVFSDHGALINQWDDKVVRYLRKFNSIFSKHTVVLTDKTKEDYIKLFKIRKNKITRIYNNIPNEFIDNSKEYNKQNNKILTVGRFTKEKGFDMLVEIGIELKKINENWTWEIYGDGEERKDIEERVRKNNLQNNIVFKGETKNIFDVYKQYAIYVLPSYREGLPLVLLEAKANKLPIVSFDIDTGPREIVENGVNGFLVEKYNKKEMAIRIDKLLRDSELRNNFSKEAYKGIKEFEEETIIKEWRELIDKI